MPYEFYQIPLAKAQLAGAAAREGFTFHHAQVPCSAVRASEPNTDSQPSYLMMTRWLAEGESMLPLYPHHQIGVGGMLLNGRGEVLCIQVIAALSYPST